MARIIGTLLATAALTGCAFVDARASGTPSDAVVAQRAQDTPLLDEIERTTFRYFVAESAATTGLTRDRSQATSPASMAAVGFSLSAYPVAVERGYLSRPEAVAYTLKTLRFLWQAPQGDAPEGMAGFHGLFYHFVSPETGARAWKCELSTIDTALLMAGVLFAQGYYDQTTPEETEIRDLADRLYRRVDWSWATNGAPQVSLGWTPESGFMPYRWGGYNEAMILVLLGLGSPTHPLPDNAWQAWAKSYQVDVPYGQRHIVFGPLFGHQYSHVWVDFHGIQDAATRALDSDYFLNSRRATLAQQRYAQANPGKWKAYGVLDWGLTACDGPGDQKVTIAGVPRTFLGYAARGTQQGPDDGTIAPTAALGSLPFAPEVVLPTARHFRTDRPDLWGRYGFKDAFNPTFPGASSSGWVDPDYLGIDEGPIMLMIENYRTGFLWQTMKGCPYVVRGLQRAGFSGGWLSQRKAGT